MMRKRIWFGCQCTKLRFLTRFMENIHDGMGGGIVHATEVAVIDKLRKLEVPQDDAATAAQIASVADAVVIGSRIIEEIESAPAGEAPARVQAWLATIRTAMDAQTVAHR